MLSKNRKQAFLLCKNYKLRLVFLLKIMTKYDVNLAEDQNNYRAFINKKMLSYKKSIDKVHQLIGIFSVSII